MIKTAPVVLKPAASLSDGELDAAFEIAAVARNTSRYVECGGEISQRLQSVASFVGAFLGSNRFPNYEKRSGFNQSDAARTSVSNSAGNLANNAAQLASGLFSKALLVLVVIGVVIYVAKKK